MNKRQREKYLVRGLKCEHMRRCGICTAIEDFEKVPLSRCEGCKMFTIEHGTLRHPEKNNTI